ncbi:MAG: anion permease, partial [Cohaesibacter sp.]|nr:anion permease [Cohaesibacter sp.]
NTATANTFVPLGISIAVGIGQHPMMIAVPMAIGAGLAFSLPVSTPPNAIVFGSGLIRIPDMFKVGILANFIGIAIALVVMYVMLPVAFGIKQGEMPAVPKVVQMKEAVLKNTMPNADDAALFAALQKAFPKLSADELNALLADR